VAGFSRAVMVKPPILNSQSIRNGFSDTRLRDEYHYTVGLGV
jgi:hypothetical protein